MKKTTKQTVIFAFIFHCLFWFNNLDNNNTYNDYNNENDKNILNLATSIKHDYHLSTSQIDIINRAER